MQCVGQGNYMVCMTDDVSEIKMMRLLSRKLKMPKGPEVLTAGGLLGVFSLGWQLINDLQVGGWGVNCAHDGRSLDPRLVSRSLGLVEGNLYGIKVNLKEEMQCLLSGVCATTRLHAECGRMVAVLYVFKCCAWCTASHERRIPELMFSRGEEVAGEHKHCRTD